MKMRHTQSVGTYLNYKIINNVPNLSHFSSTSKPTIVNKAFVQNF